MKIKIDFDVEIKEVKGGLFEVTLSKDDIKSVMPARSQEEAMGVANTAVSGFSSFVFGQSIK